MKTRSGSLRAWARRAMSLLLAAIMVMGFFPEFPGAENSGAEAQWAEPYLNQLVEWGFIRADQANNPNLALTRADFMAIVNRAYGYSTPGETPFEDVEPNKWYYDDVGIAYTARYIVGTSPTTASPNDPLTRETATTILGRNMMLQESPGEILDFTDARQISNWAMGTVKSSLEHYLINGYDDGTLRPKRNVSWGEMATMITKLIGTPLQEPGDYALGGVFGNTTITSSNVTLRDSAVSGDVYVTGGVGLGNVKLENVDVLGRIIAAGTGRSEGGEASILLRNVTADELLIDNLQDDYVSVQVDGITEINRTTVRTSAYIEDNTPDGMGLKYISIEGDSYPEGEEPDDWEPIQVDLAGRIGEVVNLTPKSQVRVGSGTVEKLTVDEAAVDSTVIIDRGAMVKELALDTATTVTGEGDIGHLIVNAPGCVIDIMPDQITIRPGITAIICGEEMDSVAAEEFSMEPLILAGYPVASDITPTGLTALFMTNKAGTIYYAVSPITEGSVGEDDLIKPPSYGSIAVAKGSVKVPQGNEEVSAAIGGLTPGGSYYLSAVLVDAKGNHSPVKVISFTTPDNTIPAFCKGYPYMDKISPKQSVVVTMTTKDCKLYYALLPQGAMAPTEDEMKTNAVAGALGYGVRDAYKNKEDVFQVNDQVLEEQTTYVLYFLLTDGVNSSKIISITFKTDDETPPEFIVEPTVTNVQATSVSLTFRLNEDGTVYWVAIPANTTNYPKPEPGTDDPFAPPDSMYGKLQIANGMNIGTRGKSGKVTCRANVDGTITVSGLEKETAYDFYYVAKDNAGPDRNYSKIWKKITIYTLDTTGPKFSQSFSDSSSPDDRSKPLASTDIYLDVTEDVRYAGDGGGRSFLELYQDVLSANTEAEKDAAREKLAASLYGAIKLNKVDPSIAKGTRELTPKLSTSATTDNWEIDYTQATVTAHEGGIRITFPNSGLKLENGATYYFIITDVTDVSNNQNPLVPSVVDFHDRASASKGGGHDVPEFTVESAWIRLDNPGVDEDPIVRENGRPKPEPAGGYAEEDYVRSDLSFQMAPVSTETVADNLFYDVLLRTWNKVTFELYYRVVDTSNKKISTNGAYGDYTYYDTEKQRTVTVKKEDYLLPHISTANEANGADVNGWFYLGNSTDLNPTGNERSGRNTNGWYFNNFTSARDFPPLNKLSSELRYEFVIHLTYVDDIPEFTDGEPTWRTWNDKITFYVNVFSGQANSLTQLNNLSGQVKDSMLDDALAAGASSIGRVRTTTEDTLEIFHSYTDSRLPRFADREPVFDPSSTSVEVDLRFSTAGTLYYVVSPIDPKTGQPGVTTTRYLLETGNDSEEGTVDPNDPNALLGVNNTDRIKIRMTDLARDGITSIAPPDDNSNIPKWMIGGIMDDPSVTVDTPEDANLIYDPQPRHIYDPKQNAETSKAISGSFPFNGREIEKLYIGLTDKDKLTPDTDYFFYCVVKGEGDTLSHVYIYHFKTKPASKPKISAEGYLTNLEDPDEGGGAQLRTDEDALIQYYVFTVSEAQRVPTLMDTIELTPDYGEYCERRNLLEGRNIKWKVDENGEPILKDGRKIYYMTVLDALVTTYNGEDTVNYPTQSGYSLFDVFASDEQRRDVNAFLRGDWPALTPALQEADKSKGEVEWPKDANSDGWIRDNGRLNRATDYVVLAVAHAKADNIADSQWEVMSFGGARINLNSLVTPRIKSWTLPLDEYWGPSTELTFNGQVSVYFIPKLYIEGSGGALEELNNENISLLGWNENRGIKLTVDSPDEQGTTLLFEGDWTKNTEYRLSLARLRSIGGQKCSGELIISVQGDDTRNGVVFKISSDAPLTPDNGEKETLLKYTVGTIVGNLNLEKYPAGSNDYLDPDGTSGTKWKWNVLDTAKGEEVELRAAPTLVPGRSNIEWQCSWVVSGPATVTPDANDSRKATLKLSNTSLTAGSEITVTIRIFVYDSANPDVPLASTTWTLTIGVTGAKSLRAYSITSSVGKVTAEAVTWDLSKSSATITLKSTSALPNTINVGSQTKLTSKALKLTKASVDNTRKTVTLQVALSGNIPADKKDTIVVTMGPLSCEIPVTYTGSQSNQSGINIATKK